MSSLGAHVEKTSLADVAALWSGKALFDRPRHASDASGTAARRVVRTGQSFLAKVLAQSL